jgi:predicted DNA-binding transcriptional regulator AlpA
MMTEINPESILGSREIYTSPLYPISKDILFRKINTGEFPKPMKAGNSFFWLKADVDLFFELNA